MHEIKNSDVDQVGPMHVITIKYFCAQTESIQIAVLFLGEENALQVSILSVLVDQPVMDQPMVDQPVVNQIMML